MDRIKLILIYVSVSLSFGLVRGQQVGNYVNNGSFESVYTCTQTNLSLKNIIYWNSLDSINNTFGGVYTSTCQIGGASTVPLNAYSYQFPRTGGAHVLGEFFYPNIGVERGYFKNRLVTKLSSGKTYCAKMYVNRVERCMYSIDAIGMYFGGNELDTISKPNKPLPFLTPQIQTSTVILDTINWVAISGTFVATGNEKYLLVGCFKSNSAVNFSITNTNTVWAGWAGYNVDDISCIEINLPAYAGANQLIYLGDSAFIGRQPDFATDSGCIWYKLPNMTTAIDTISGLWVKPTVTSTYVVRQELDCSPLKWDTVVVTINTNLVSLDKLHELSADISLFPNPTSGNLKVSYSGSTDLDITSYVVLNSLGQTVRDEYVHDIPVDIQTSDLGPGLYEIQFRSRFGILTKKFVKTN
jgi:hypothetical protein